MSRANHVLDYSIVVCVYNPDERILKRCLQAIRDLQREDLSTEVILADNNSTIPVGSLPFVSELAGQIPGMQIIQVKEQGVKYARMAAIEAAKGAYIVYFDYDNEPDSDYLLELRKLHVLYPQVAAWGPGNVTVDFIDGVSPRLENYARFVFQERHEQAVVFDNKWEWQSCYPYGTGLCTAACLLKEYIELARQGRFTLTGRKGNQLSSGEDTQMVLLCICRGHSAGVSPALKVRHIIPQQRANYAYIKRLVYGTAVCYETCLLQVFPEYRPSLERKYISGNTFTRRSLKRYIKARWSFRFRRRVFELIEYIGANASVYQALERPLPGWVNRLLKHMKLN